MPAGQQQWVGKPGCLQERIVNTTTSLQFFDFLSNRQPSAPPKELEACTFKEVCSRCSRFVPCLHPMQL
jgi:hypothetical protein